MAKEKSIARMEISYTKAIGKMGNLLVIKRSIAKEGNSCIKPKATPLRPYL
jgi:hypothetical protein